MNSRNRYWLVAILCLAWALAVVPAFGSRDYPPRVSQIDGTASYEQAGNVNWEDVTVNLPLLTGDRIFSQVDSRVEVDLGRANFLRLGPETDLAFGDITGRELRVQLHSGALILRVNDAEPFRIQTLLGDVVIRKKGVYRINVDPAGRIEVVVRRGKAEVQTGSGGRNVNAGQILRLDAGGRREVAYGYYEDNLDLWSDRQDSRYHTSRSVAYVGGQYYPGVWDLDYYGQWAYYPAYGRVWVPSVSFGWVPFRYGRWGYHSFGWTWISYEPWGWLPYHYGSWVYHHSRWCWVPGGFNTWSPAVVNFYFGDGYVGWTPRYWGRGYGNSTVIINNNTTIINENERRGLTVIRNDDFGRSRRVSDVVVSRPDPSLTNRLRAGLPNDLRDPASARTRTVARGETNPAGRRDLATRGNSFTGGSTDRSTIGRPATGTAPSGDRSVTRTRVGERPETNPTNGPRTVTVPPGRSSTERRETVTDRAQSPGNATGGQPAPRTERPETRTYRVPDTAPPRNTNRPEAAPSRNVERPPATSRPSGEGNTYRAPASPPPRQAAPRRTEPATANPARPDNGLESRSVAPSGPRSVAPSGPRSVMPSSPRSVTPAAPRSVAPSAPRSIAPESPRSVVPSAPRSVSPAAPRSIAPSSPRSVAPSAPRQERSYQAPSAPSRSAAPSVSRPAPSSAPRSAPAVQRAPARSAPSASRPATSRPPDRH